MFSLLKRLWSGSANTKIATGHNSRTLQGFTPRTKSHLAGFTVQVERKEGCILQSRPKDSPEDTPYSDSGVDGYFEVTVDYDGSNPLYPKAKQGSRVVCQLTNSLKEGGFSMVNGMYAHPAGTVFTRVEIEEKYEDWKDADSFGFRGGRPLPEYVAWLRMYVKGPNDERDYASGTGIATRPA